MSTPTNPPSSTAMSVFIPRSVAAYESAADRWHGRFFAPTQALTQRTLGFAERLMSGWLGSFHLGWNQPVAQRTTVAPQTMNVVRPWYDQPAPVASRPMARSFASGASTPSSYAPSAAAPMSSVASYDEMVTLTLPPEALLASAAISTSAEAPAAAPLERRVREFFPEVVRPAAPVLSTAQREAIGVARAAAITSAAPSSAPSAPIASSFEAPNRELLASAYAAEAAATAAYTPALTMVYQPAPAARALYHLAWADSQLARSTAAGAPQVAATMAPQVTSPVLASASETSPAIASSAALAAAMRTALPVETAARMVVRDGFVYLAPPAPATAPVRSMAAPSAAPSYAAPALSLAPSFAASLPPMASSPESAPLAPSPAAIAAAASLASYASPAALWQSTIAPATSFAASLPAMATASIGAASNVALGASLVVAPTAMQQSIGAFLAQRLSTQTLADVGAGPTPQALARLTQTPSPEMIVLQSPAIVAAVAAASSRGAALASSALPMTASTPSFAPAATPSFASPLVPSSSASSAAPAQSFAAPAVSGAASFGPAVEQLLATYAEAQAASVAPRFRPGHLGVQLDAQVQSIVSHLASSWGHSPVATAELTPAASRWAASPSFSYVAPATQPSAGIAQPARSVAAPPVGSAPTAPSFAPSPLPWAVPAAYASWTAPAAVQPLGLPSFVEWFMPPALEPSAAAVAPRSFAGPTAAMTSLPFAAPAASTSAAASTATAASRGFAPSYVVPSYVVPSYVASPLASTIASPSALAPMWAGLEAAPLGPAAILSFVEQMPALATLRALQPTQLAALAFATPDVASFQEPAAAAAVAQSTRAVDAPAMPSLQAWSSPALEALSPQQRATVIAQLSAQGQASVAFAPSLVATTAAPSQPFASAATMSFAAAPDLAPPGAAAVRSEALAAAVALRSSNLASDFVDPVVLTLLQREGFVMPTVAPASSPASRSVATGGAMAPMPTLTMVAAPPSTPPAGSPSSSFTPSASGWAFQPSLLPSAAFSFETISAAAPELLGAAPSAPRSMGAMAPLEWTLLSVFPSASTAAELGLTSARAAAPSRASAASVAPSSLAVPSFAASSGSAASFAAELVAPFLGSAPTSGAPIGARGPAWAPAAESFDAASAAATRAPILSALDMVRGPDVLRLPSGAQPRGGFLWPSATSHATSGHTSLIQPEMFTDTAVQAQLIAISGRTLEAPQPLWEMLRAPAGAASMGAGGTQVPRSFDASGAPFVQSGDAFGGPEAPSRRAMGDLPTLSAAATQAAPRYAPSSEVERLQPVLDLLRGAPSAPSNETGGEAPQSIRYERAMPIIAAQPSSEAAASIMQAVRAVGPSSPSDDRLTLADLTMITMATATMNFAASDEGGAPAAPAGGGGGGGGGGGAAAAGGGAAGGDAGPQVEELAQKVYEAYLRLIEIQRERSGESWES